MQKYQKVSIIVLVVCLLACLLPGCSNIGSEDWVLVYRDSIPDYTVALEKDGTATVMLTGIVPEFHYLERFDVETSLQMVHYGTYEKEDTTLTIQCSGDLYQRQVVRGKGKAAYIKERVSPDGWSRAYFEKGELVSMGEVSTGESIIIEIDTSEDTWKLISERRYYESGALFSLMERSDSGNFVSTAYYENGKIRSLYEYDLDGIVTSGLGYHENGNVSFQREYYEDGTEKSCVSYYENGNISREEDYYEDGREKSRVDYYENGNVWIQKEYYEDGTEKSYVEYYENGNVWEQREFYADGQWKKKAEYDEDGTEREYREYDQDGNVIVERP